MNRLNKQSLIILSLAISACGGGSKDPTPNEPTIAYTCGEMVANESCITLVSPDDFSSERHFILNIPDSVSNNAPLFVLLHGGGGSANRVADRFSFREFIQQNGYIGIFLNSIVRDDGVSTWNAHNATYGISHINDVKFIGLAIDKVVNENSVDGNRVYVFGWSNGGFMANRLACESPQSITAIFTLAGNLRDSLKGCNNSDSVSIHHLHPTGDNTVPFAGDDTRGYISAEEAIGRWVEFNNCESDPVSIGPFDLTFDEDGEETNTFIYQGCDAAVDFTVIDGSDHGPDFKTEEFHQYLADYFSRVSM